MRRRDIFSPSPITVLGLTLLPATLGALLLCLTARGASAQQPAGTVSFESINFPGQFIRHRNFLGYISPIINDLDRADATFVVRPGLRAPEVGTVSFESVNFPGYFLRHQDFRVKLQRNDGSELFAMDGSFLRTERGTPEMVSFEALNFRGYFIRHRNFELWIAKFDGSPLFVNDETFRRHAGLAAAGGQVSSPAQIPRISVSLPSSRNFLVTGSGFLPAQTVHIRVADDFLNPNLFFNTTATANGTISASLAIPCNPGQLHFSANDGRPDRNDVTGTLWSNTATLSCQ